MSLHRVRWCDRHPVYFRFYVPVWVAVSVLVQVWEVVHR